MFLLVMAAGSIVGTFIGGRLLRYRADFHPIAVARGRAGHFGSEGVAAQITALR